MDTRRRYTAHSSSFLHSNSFRPLTRRELSENVLGITEMVSFQELYSLSEMRVADEMVESYIPTARRVAGRRMSVERPLRERVREILSSIPHKSSTMEAYKTA